MNPYKNEYNNKRYNTINNYYKEKFKTKVFKVSLNANFTCPNIDGTVGYGGCIYCSKTGSGEYAGNVNDSLEKQFNDLKTKLHEKWSQAKYIGYFQARTNTYAPLEELKEKYETILNLPHVLGLSIATRPDCINEEILCYLEQLNKKTHLTIELGLQSIHPETIKLINRCHDLQCFEEMVYKLKQRNINVVVHIINGLPYERKEMMLDTIKYLNKLPIMGIKIHMLNILKDTPLLTLYKKEKFKLLTKEEYINIVCEQIENLRPDIIIERITGDANPDDLIEPKWALNKISILNTIDQQLKIKDTYQGFNLNILNKEKQIIKQHLNQNDLVIDATIGNGNDTLFLASIVKKGFVFGFDIQTKAINNTKTLLNNNNLNNYKLYKIGHEKMLNTLNDYINKISLIIFNLGYLPKGNKKITTTYKTTIIAIKNSLELLNNKGIILIVVYPGHSKGQKESEAIQEYLTTLNNYQITYYHNTINKNAPYLIKIKRT